jgi:hypothetical protein
MSTQRTFRSDVFNHIFANQFGYPPIRDGKQLFQPTDKVTYQKLNHLQLMGYIPYVVEVLENPTKYPNPNWKMIVRLKGTAKETSCSSLRTIYKRIGLIDYNGRTMVKGKNYDRVLDTKWDWFHNYGTSVFISGEKYTIRELLWLDNQHKHLCMMDETEHFSLIFPDVWDYYHQTEDELSKVLNKKVNGVGRNFNL